MSARGTPGGALPADAEYAARHQSLSTQQAAAERRDTVLGRVKLALGALVLLLAVVAISHPGVAAYIVAAIVLFVALAIVHERLLRSIARRGRQLRFYARGLGRLDGTWRTAPPAPAKRGRDAAPAETGPETGGEAFRTPDHPYAADLDLFGRGSLFHLLSTARTAAGERTLADWLLAPASPEVVVERQAAVEELAPLLDLREQLATVGEDIRASVHAATLTEWAEASSGWRGAAPLRIAAFVLGGIWVAAVVYWAVAGSATPLIASTVVNVVLRGLLAGRIDDALSGLDRTSQELAVLSALLAVIEREPFRAPLLTGLQAALKTDGIAPSAAIARLGRIVQLLDASRNMVFIPFDYGLLWRVHFAIVASRWRTHFGPHVRQWLAAMGEFEALVSLASHTYEHPEDIFPRLERESGDAARTRLVIESFAHPLLDAGTAVRNDLTLSSHAADNLQLVVISGPNMAGKSTFLRGLGVNVVLAQAGAPVRARAMRLTPLAVAASISVSDSLASGISRFYAEIRRVKLVSDLADGPLPVLFLLDELLSGTNSHDRFIGTEFVVRSLLERGAIGIVTTHDLALTVIPERLPAPMRGINSHFEDRIERDPIEGDRLSFDYRLTPGIVQTSNALALMRSIGLKVDG